MNVSRIIVTGCLLTMTSMTAMAETMWLSETNLIIVRVGDGSQTLTNTGNSFFLDQYTTAGGYVGTLNAPDRGTNAMTMSGDSFEESYLTRSLDGRLLCLAAYGTPVGGTNVLDASGGTNVARIVATVNAAGTWQWAIVTSNDYSGAAWRSAATDGTNNYWGAASDDGTIYLGNASPRAVVQNSKLNCRIVEIFNGNLYMASASSVGDNKRGIYEFNGLPQGAVGLPAAIIYTNTFDTNTFQGITDFAVNPSATVIYFADERDISGVAGGIQRWNLISGKWSNAYNLTNGLGGVGASHLAVDWSGASPVIYATTSESTNGVSIPNRLIKIVDTGQSSPATILAVAGTNQFFRGVKFGPSAMFTPPQSLTANLSNGAGLKLHFSGTTNYPYVLQSATNLTPPISWQSIITNPADGNGSWQFVDTNLNRAQKFYRAMVR